MPNETNNSKKKAQNRGFYIALGACILALSGAVYVGMSGILDKVGEQELEAPVTSEEVEQVDVTPSAVEIESEAEEPVSEEPVKETATEPQPAELKFIQPLDGKILNEYSNGELVKSKTLDEWRTHDGVDIAATANTPVKAAADGMVDEITEDPLWGVCITLSHEGNVQTMYKGLKAKTDVKVGQSVTVGSIIGYVGNTAEIEIAEDSHLHYAAKRDGSWIDPMGLVKK